MLNFPVLNTEVQRFIDAHIGADISKLALKKNPFPEISWIEILNQVAAKTKAKEKLSTWFNSPNIVYPAKISVEQTSSEKTALYKSQIVSGKNLIDLTGGFGVDDYYFSKTVNTVIHCEINETLSKLVQHNFKILNADRIQCYLGDSLTILKKINQQFDWIYIDPSRRNDVKGKVFLLKDCLPNVPELLDNYFGYSDQILIKTAPILDISAGLSELKHVKRIHIIALENEVKELLWECSKGFKGNPVIQTVNFSKEKTETFDFEWHTATESVVFGLPKKHIYEPNSAIMKSGGFDEVSIHFSVEKLHPHSHLYTSEILILDFPGRIFEVQNCIPYAKKEMKMALENQKANITTRNFPDSVASIREKWKIKEGGDLYCFFTTDWDNRKIVLICTKIK